MRLDENQTVFMVGVRRDERHERECFDTKKEALEFAIHVHENDAFAGLWRCIIKNGKIVPVDDIVEEFQEALKNEKN